MSGQQVVFWGLNCRLVKLKAQRILQLPQSTHINVSSDCLNKYGLFPEQNKPHGRSQWPRGLGHEMSSVARTLESWVQISFKE
jgi:hypothetical protein